MHHIFTNFTCHIYIIVNLDLFYIIIVKKEDLDKELDQYMVNTKALNELDHIMN